MAYKKVQISCVGQPTEAEYQVAAAVTPGRIVELTSAGKVQHHSTAGGKCLKCVALGMPEIGKTITDASGASDFIRVWFPKPGDIGAISIAVSQNVSIGDWVESNGDGTVRKAAADTSAGTIVVGSLIGQVLEATNLTHVVLVQVRFA